MYRCGRDQEIHIGDELTCLPEPIPLACEPLHDRYGEWQDVDGPKEAL